jgi:hypothetical protein
MKGARLVTGDFLDAPSKAAFTVAHVVDFPAPRIAGSNIRGIIEFALNDGIAPIQVDFDLNIAY